MNRGKKVELEFYQKVDNRDVKHESNHSFKFLNQNNILNRYVYYGYVNCP